MDGLDRILILCLKLPTDLENEELPPVFTYLQQKIYSLIGVEFVKVKGSIAVFIKGDGLGILFGTIAQFREHILFGLLLLIPHRKQPGPYKMV
jgi:hypothetical protein